MSSRLGGGRLLWAYAPRDVEVASIIGGCCTAVRRARIPGAVPEAGAPPAGRRPRAVSQFARTRPLHRTAEQITRARIPMHRLSARPASAGVVSAGFQAQIVGQPVTRFHERAAASPPPHPTRNAAPSIEKDQRTPSLPLQAGSAYFRQCPLPMVARTLGRDCPYVPSQCPHRVHLSSTLSTFSHPLHRCRR